MQDDASRVNLFTSTLVWQFGHALVVSLFFVAWAWLVHSRVVSRIRPVAISALASGVLIGLVTVIVSLGLCKVGTCLGDRIFTGLNEHMGFGRAATGLVVLVLPLILQAGVYFALTARWSNQRLSALNSEK